MPGDIFWLLYLKFCSRSALDQAPSEFAELDDTTSQRTPLLGQTVTELGTRQMESSTDSPEEGTVVPAPATWAPSDGPRGRLPGPTPHRRDPNLDFNKILTPPHPWDPCASQSLRFTGLEQQFSTFFLSWHTYTYY